MRVTQAAREEKLDMPAYVILELLADVAVQLEPGQRAESGSHLDRCHSSSRSRRAEPPESFL